MALRATEMNEDAGTGEHETGSAGDLVAGFLQGGVCQYYFVTSPKVTAGGPLTNSRSTG